VLIVSNVERAGANVAVTVIADCKYGRNSAIYSAKGIENQSRKSISPKRRPRSKNSFSAASKDEVTIHVCDEGRRTSKYFFCQKKLLVQVRRLSVMKIHSKQSNSYLELTINYLFARLTAHEIFRALFGRKR
jgi:hypothetical protein